MVIFQMNRVLTNYPNYSVSSTGDVYSNPLTFKDSIGRTRKQIHKKLKQHFVVWVVVL